MKSRNLIMFLGVSAFMTSCMSSFEKPYDKTEHGVKVKMNDSLTIAVDVIDEDIFHVVKNTGKKSTLPDYVVTLTPQDVKWSTDVEDGKLKVSTSRISALIDASGNIEYLGPDGKRILAETEEETYISNNEFGTCTVSQGFLAGDEALYGLGQFQSGIMDWKNIPVRLTQHNQEVSVPFILSTNGYGIYWNNYSMTYVNPAQHEVMFSDADFHSVSQDLNLKDGQEAENAGAIKIKAFKEKNIREVMFAPRKSGVYTFYVDSNNDKERMRGDVKVIIDNDTIINYTTVWVPNSFSGYKSLEAGKQYKLTFQNTGSRIPGHLMFNEPDYDKTVFRSVSGTSIDYYVIFGDTPSDILEANHRLSGKTPLFPKKAYGFWQCRERYHNQKELLDNANEMRKRQIPFDYIIQDWFYWPDKTKGPEWDRTKYPDPKAMVDELKSLNTDILVSVWPQVINEPLLAKYDLEHLKFKNNKNLDFFNQEVMDRYYRMLSDSMFHIGVEGIWIDGTEPSGRPSDNTATAVGPFRDVRNIYSLLVTGAMFEGMQKEYPGRRVINLNRSSFTGQQRYGTVTWSGDVAGTWEQFAEQIAAGLNFTMAGIPYWTHDIGGFFRDSKSMNPRYDSQYTNVEYKELLTRWFQFGTFSPIFRIHGYVSETEIWRYGKEFEDMARKYIDLRYQLIPYIYSEAWKVYNGGHLLMSPLAYYYPKDKNVWGIKDQYFFGENMMVGIVTSYGQREKEMYLPEGDWYDFWTDKKYQGSQKVTIPAALDSNPLLVKAGSILPFGPKVQYATQPTDEPMTIKVYPGKDAEYTLYYDDNFTTSYQNGQYTEITFRYKELSSELQILSASGNFIDFAKIPLNFKIDKVGSSVNKTVTYKGELINIILK